MVLSIPGRLNARLRLETPTDASDGQGGMTGGWTVGCRSLGSDRAVARKSRRRGGRGSGAGQPPGHHPHRDDVSHAMRFVFRGRVLLMRAVRDPDESRRYLICDCEEATP
jgi:head-tail adaptor